MRLKYVRHKKLKLFLLIQYGIIIGQYKLHRYNEDGYLINIMAAHAIMGTDAFIDQIQDLHEIRIVAVKISVMDASFLKLK